MTSLGKKFLTRRKFLALALLSTPAAIAADAKLIEPTWLKVRQLRIGNSVPTHRLVHFTDLHHKGDRNYLQSVVDTINSLTPDFVCFTGDLIEEQRFLAEALEILSGIKAPMYGVPGNHEYWSKVAFEPIAECFTATGGAWLMDASKMIAGGKVNLIGITCNHGVGAGSGGGLPLDLSRKNILLMHYPSWAKKLGGLKIDLMLAGHSHGGQVRIPIYGPVMLPFGVDEYDMGLFLTAAGPLYVNPGIGYVYGYDVRFNCRPEITVIEI